MVLPEAGFEEMPPEASPSRARCCPARLSRSYRCRCSLPRPGCRLRSVDLHAGIALAEMTLRAAAVAAADHVAGLRRYRFRRRRMRVGERASARYVSTDVVAFDNVGRRDRAGETVNADVDTRVGVPREDIASRGGRAADGVIASNRPQRPPPTPLRTPDAFTGALPVMSVPIKLPSTNCSRLAQIDIASTPVSIVSRDQVARRRPPCRQW